MRRLALSGVVCLPTLIAAVALADAPLRLNEIRLEQPGKDADEYIEVAGAPGESLAGVSIVVIGDDDDAFPGQQNGYIESVVSLSGAMPASGFFVVAKDGFSLGTPNLVANLNLEGDDNVTVLLVRGFTGFGGQKLDTNDDGTLDVSPWDSVVASVAVLKTVAADGNASDYYYSTTTVGPDAGQQPAAAWLCANSPQWIVGSQDPFGGVDSPGAANQACETEALRINEIRIDMTGTDINEYVEFRGAPGTSLAGLTYFVIGDGAGGSGVVESVIALPSDAVIGSSGFYLVTGNGFNLAATPDLRRPTNDIFENSDNVTHLLVRGFTGAANNDLDTNNDGVLDSTPWAEIVDSVALLKPITATGTPATGDEWWYSTTTVGPDGTFVPGHVYRCTPDATWKIGPFDIVSGRDTPRAANAGCTTCGPGAGNCHAVHATPGCVDSTCCNLVCGSDPTCCNATWDQDCVNLARQFCLVAGTPPTLSFNELRIDEPGNTDPNEYIEIKGAPGANLNGVSVIVVGDGADLNGNVETVISLNGATMPKDGIFLLGKSTLTLATPDAVRAFGLENGDSVTYFLVWNWTGLPNTDYDLDNDGTLDSLPWDSSIDSLAIKAGDGRLTYSANSVGPDYGGFPAHVVKCTDNAWRFGRFDPAATDGFGSPGVANETCPPAYTCGDTQAPSCFTPHGTPGCADEACCRSVCVIDITCCEVTWDADCANQATLNCFTPSNPPAVQFSEIRIDQTSFDLDEYVEVVGESGTLLNGLNLIVIGDGATTAGSGVIEYIYNFQGNRIPDDGLFVASGANSTLVGAAKDDNLNLVQDNFENSDNMTFMLVWGFTGALNQDLDTDDDGDLDVTPWTTVIDSVAFIESAAIPPVGTEWAYSETRLGPDAAGFVPSQLAYCPSTDVWTIGTFATNSKTVDSPGAGNFGCEYTGPACPADLDGDGTVGASDLATVLGSWGASKSPADLDGDGTVGASDLAAVLGAWGACP
ncbi:MAG: Leukotoxin [Planctomycetota bacterium]